MVTFSAHSSVSATKKPDEKSLFSSSPGAWYGVNPNHAHFLYCLLLLLSREELFDASMLLFLCLALWLVERFRTGGDGGGAEPGAADLAWCLSMRPIASSSTWIKDRSCCGSTSRPKSICILLSSSAVAELRSAGREERTCCIACDSSELSSTGGSLGFRFHGWCGLLLGLLLLLSPDAMVEMNGMCKISILKRVATS